MTSVPELRVLLVALKASMRALAVASWTLVMGEAGCNFLQVLFFFFFNQQTYIYILYIFRYIVVCFWSLLKWLAHQTAGTDEGA